MKDDKRKKTAEIMNENGLYSRSLRERLLNRKFSTECHKIYTARSRRANLSKHVLFLKIDQKFWLHQRVSQFFLPQAVIGVEGGEEAYGLGAADGGVGETEEGSGCTKT